MRRRLRRIPFGNTRLSSSAADRVRQRGHAPRISRQPAHPLRRQQQPIQQRVAEAVGAARRDVQFVLRQHLCAPRLQRSGDGMKRGILLRRSQPRQLTARLLRGPPHRLQINRLLRLQTVPERTLLARAWYPHSSRHRTPPNSYSNTIISLRWSTTGP